VTEVVYAGRLDAIAECAVQGTSVGTGIRYLPVEHEGNRSIAPEEVEAIECADLALDRRKPV
jgi:hypothetical protein